MSFWMNKEVMKQSAQNIFGGIKDSKISHHYPWLSEISGAVHLASNAGLNKVKN